MDPASGAATSTASLLQLPHELLIPILSHVRDQCTASDYLSTLLVNKQLHALAQPVLYKDVVLDTGRIPRFVRAASNHNQALISSINSLSLHLSPSKTVTSLHQGYCCEPEDLAPELRAQILVHLWWNGSVEVHQLWHDLSALASLFPGMTRLRSFSFSVRDASDSIELCFPCSLIASLVRALPDSCVELEIDTDGKDDGRDRRGAGKDMFLCEDLREVLPRLQHHHFKAHRLCPSWPECSDEFHEKTFGRKILLRCELVIRQLAYFAVNEQ
ncbi:MAG: hypothetical protein M1816_001977 [Peltula sp. TS41687]|nr:MAG: hypothetical protein M1816_001977 [Peltula sp. TS41687]